MANKLWILRPRQSLDPRWTYDCAFGFVVRAATEADARTIAQQGGGDEIGPRYDSESNRLASLDSFPAWLDSEHSTCVELPTDGEAGEIMQDFNAG